MPLGRCLAILVVVLVLAACQSPVQTPPATPQPPAATASRVDTLGAADAAFSSGDLKTAAGLYERVVNTPPSASESAAISPALTDLADFRAMVTLLADSREEEARTHLDALQQRDPSSPFARLASQLWDQYGMTGQLSSACGQLQPQIASQAGAVLTSLQSLGVRVDAATLCTAPPASAA